MWESHSQKYFVVKCTHAELSCLTRHALAGPRRMHVDGNDGVFGHEHSIKTGGIDDNIIYLYKKIRVSLFLCTIFALRTFMLCAYVVNFVGDGVAYRCGWWFGNFDGDHG